MKYTPETITEICKWIRAGNSFVDAAALAGISEDTFHTWKKEKPEFSEQVKSAEKEFKARNIAIIMKAAEKSWQAAAWLLERKYSDEFALKHLMEHTGRDGQPLQVQIIAPVQGILA